MPNSQIRIVLTGGPSAGKTTLLDLLSKQFGDLIGVAPEAASILFRGGFPRPVTHEDRIHTQRSIYALQRELELQALERAPGIPVFCDRGALDGAAYWDGSVKEFCFAMGTSIEREFERYSAVVHLQTAPEGRGYTNNDVRTESPAEAARLDARIGQVWSSHPNYFFISNPETGGFLAKINTAMAALEPYLPPRERLAASLRYATAGDLL